MAKASLITKKELLILILIISVGAFLRLYRIADYMTFLGDEGRDAIIVRRLLVDFDPILVGPGTSIGNMYLGPLYYYLIAPALLFANFSPVGPSILVALISLATIFLIWKAGREWFGEKAGLIASFLYAISPVVIIYSRSSWNPNVAPFFALLCIYSIYKVRSKIDFKYLPIAAGSLAFVLNSHYLGLLLIPTMGLWWLLTLYEIRKSDDKKSLTKKFAVHSAIALAIFTFLMSPLVIFDARHGYRNVEAMKVFFTQRQTTVSARPWNSIPKLYPILEKVSLRLIAAKNEMLGKAVALIILATLPVLAGISKIKIEKEERRQLFLLTLWLLFSLVGLALYKQEVYDHYYGFFFPAPFLIIGALMQKLIDNFKLRGTWLALTLLVFLTYYNFLESPLKYSPNRQLERSKVVSEKIIEESKGEKFNLAVIAERNYDDGYEYFLRRKGAPITDIDPQNTKDTIASQLFVICEMPPEKCKPTTNPKAEVANFGWSQIESTQEVFGTTLFKLVHTQK